MLKDSQLDLCGRVDFARTTPLLVLSLPMVMICGWEPMVMVSSE